MTLPQSLSNHRVQWDEIGRLAGMLGGAALTLLNPWAGFGLFLLFALWVAHRNPVWAVAGYFFLAPFPLGVVIFGHKLWASDILALVIAGVLVVTGWRRGWRYARDIFLTPAFRWPLVMLLGLSVLSLAVAWSRIGTVIKILEYVEFFVVMVAAVRTIGDGETDARRYLFALLLGSVLVSLWGVVQFLFGLGPPANQIALVHVRATGFFGQPNPFGAFGEFLFPLLLGQVVFGPDTVRRAWWLQAGLFLVALGVVVSYSRGAWVGDAAAVAVMGLAALLSGQRSALPRWALYGIGVPVLAFVLAAGLTHVHVGATTAAPKVVFHHRTTVSRVRSLVTPTHSYDNQQRLLIWRTAETAIRRYPWLGVGLGNFHRFIQRYPPHGLVGGIPPTAADLYLEWGADLGIGGLLVGLWLEWRWIAAGAKAIREAVRASSPFWYAAAIGGLGTVVAFVVHDWVDFMIDHGVVAPLLLALGLIARILDRRRSSTAATTDYLANSPMPLSQDG